MKQRLANLRHEEDGMRRHVKLVQAKGAQFDKERQELLSKRERAVHTPTPRPQALTLHPEP